VANIPHTGDTGNLLMGGGALTSWFWVGIEWTNDHSGLFVAIAAIVSTVITIIGAVKAAKYRKEHGQSGGQ
jgi:hypothetical protein